MFNFFVDTDARQGNLFHISGADYNHIRNVLRMVPGDTFLVSCGGTSCLCSLESFGVSYMSPLADGGPFSLLKTLIRSPLYRDIYRDSSLNPLDDRRQR